METRERVSFPREQLSDALLKFKNQIGECVILSTCNRTEIYGASDKPLETAEQVRALLAGYHGLRLEDIGARLYQHTDADAVRHLFRVASGLDSMIVGESQILGQVRQALTAASESQSAQASLVALFHAAVRVGRRVRKDTDVGQNALSISHAAIRLAQRVMGTLGGLSVLLIGAGEAGRLVAAALRTVGVTDLMIANRTRARGEELARTLGGRAQPFSQIEDSLREASIVIAATESSEFVITEEVVKSARRERREAGLFLFDLAVPRAIDPRVASLDGVSLFNIDDLSSIAEENLAERRRAAYHAEDIIEDELAHFMGWWLSLDAIPTVKALRQRAEDIRRREVDRAVRKMPDIPSGQLDVVEALTRAIVKRLLHDPTVFLKQQADKSQLQVARSMFGLSNDS